MSRLDFVIEEADLKIKEILRVTSIQKGQKIVFKENDMCFGQDFSFWRSIPHDIEWEVTDVYKEDRYFKLTLRSYGYGILGSSDGKSYGNGQIFVTFDLVEKKRRNEFLFIKEIK